MIYRSYEEAMKASRAGRAVSSLMQRPTPRGTLPAVIVMDRHGAHYAYGSANGIAIPATYGRPTAQEIDSIREWRVG